MHLKNNQLLPTIVGPTVGGGDITFPADLAGTWGVLIFYRGHW